MFKIAADHAGVFEQRTGLGQKGTEEPSRHEMHVLPGEGTGCSRSSRACRSPGGRHTLRLSSTHGIYVLPSWGAGVFKMQLGTQEPMRRVQAVSGGPQIGMERKSPVARGSKFCPVGGQACPRHSRIRRSP